MNDVEIPLLSPPTPCYARLLVFGARHHQVRGSATLSREELGAAPTVLCLRAIVRTHGTHAAISDGEPPLFLSSLSSLYDREGGSWG